MPARRLTLWSVLSATVVLAGLALSRSEAPAADAAKGAATPKPAPTVIGRPESAKWSATTYEAAAAEANKKVLASGRKTTVTGEVVDVSCYLQLGKRGEAHVACGTKCLQHGEPAGIVDDKGVLYILFAEEHHPRRDGEVDVRKMFLPYLAKRVTVTGMVTDMRGVKGLFVPAAELGGMVTPGEGGPAR
jgi:hypothetical protein